MGNIKKILYCFLGCFFIIGASYYLLSKKNNVVYTANEYFNIAKHYKNKRDVEKEILFLKKVLQIKPDHFFANKRLAMLLYENDKDQEALALFKKAYEHNSDAKDCLYYMSYIYYHGAYDAQNAAKYMEQFIAFDKNNVTAYILLHDCYMRLHQFKKAHAQHDKKDVALFQKGLAKLPDKIWDGSDLRGKTILVRDNVGIGDLFCWLRYIQRMKQMGATVVLHVRPYLVPILSTCLYIDKIIPKGKPVPPFDYQVPVGRIPYYFIYSIDAMKMDAPYMYANDMLTLHWKNKLVHDTGFKVGVCWDPCVYKNKKNKVIIKNKRAIPLCFFSLLAHVEHTHFYSLQRVNGVGQINNAGFELSVFGEQFDKKYGSFSDTAAVMKNLDLIITADTSVAHLAGALGVAVWVLLPFVPDWRWTMQEGITPLYPTMRLFRQKNPGDWESVMKDVYQELCALVKKENA